jgi:thiol-disulfide isomerase/thioredoxin
MLGAIFKALFSLSIISIASTIQHDLNSTTLSSFLRQNKLKKNGVILKFHAPWCVHCVRFQDDYKKLDSTSTRKKYKMAFGSIDITNNSKIASQFNIQGVPALFYIEGSKVWKYSGDMNHDHVLEFMENIKKYPPIPSWNNPLSFVGLTRGLYGSLVSEFYLIHPRFVEYTGLSRWTGFFVLIVGFALTVLLATILFVFLTLDSKHKTN